MFFIYLSHMFIKQIKKQNTKKGKAFYQYQLTQSSRVNGKAKHISLLYLGSHPLLQDKENRREVARILQAKIHGQGELFRDGYKPDREIIELAEHFYKKYKQTYQDGYKEPTVKPSESNLSDYQQVDLNSTTMESGKEIGAERLCWHMLERMDIEEFLKTKGWKKQAIDHAKIAIISRAITGFSEHKTAQWLRNNTGLPELFNISPQDITRHHLYYAATGLYEIKQQLERHMYNRCLNMFNLDDTLAIYDLTNTYFEGRKAESDMARYGRSKEKRNDCKQLVLACVINSEGFIRHSEIYRGNMDDPSTLKDVVENLQDYVPKKTTRQTVVMDAGIASEANLKMLRERNLYYVCVSPGKLKNYQALVGEDKVTVRDSQDNNLQVKLLEPEDKPDRWMYVKSPQKTLKETSMHEKLMQRFEQELQKVQEGIEKPSGTKRIEKVWERIGRIKERNKTVHQYYDIEVGHDGKKATRVSYTRKKQPDKSPEERAGVYFIRTNYPAVEEKQLWHLYNTIREVESTFRCLKTDLNLRPIYHQNDKHSKAHLFLALIAYQVVASIRYMTSKQGISHGWTNIVRIMNTQKLVSMSQHTKTGKIGFKQTTKPTNEALEIYKACNISSVSERLKKFVVYH